MAALTVSFCVAEVKPLAAAVMVGVPAAVSLYWKLTVAAPAKIVSGEMGVNAPFAEHRAQVYGQCTAGIDGIAE